MLIVNEELCIGCKMCEKACPFDAIHVDPNTKKAVVNEKCTLCGACVNVCPTKALTIERRTVSEEELKQYKDVLVWGEWEKKDGKPHIKGVVLELLGKARELAEKLEEKVGVILAGYQVEPLVEELIQHGADKVYLCEHELLETYTTDGYATVISSVISMEKPSIVLYGATPNGRDLAPRIAGRLRVGITADCTGLDINEKRQLVQTRPAFGGNIMASIISPYTRPQMATVRPNVFNKPEPNPNNKGEVIKVEVTLTKQAIRTTIIEDVALEEEIENIEEARILVSAGKGIGKKENLKMIQELAKVMGGTLSGSRALVDQGWLPQPRQVGQSGKTVAPSLYMALGISGAIQHIVGMSSSDTVIAVNKDPEAPIFKVADLGVIGDLNEIVPELIQLIKEYKEKKQ